MRASYILAAMKPRIVYSSSAGRMCPTCGWPADNCQCSKNQAREAVPDRVVAKLRLETKGRGGKGVTVVYDLPRNAEFLKTLSQELKRSCGVGGTSTDDTIELQGDQRERLRALLKAKGYLVKG
jgi:translation initiation factor 1